MRGSVLLETHSPVMAETENADTAFVHSLQLSTAQAGGGGEERERERERDKKRDLEV